MFLRGPLNGYQEKMEIHVKTRRCERSTQYNLANLATGAVIQGERLGGTNSGR